jgi:hypothetical protein
MKKFLAMVPYIYLLRFPLIFALILLLFPYVALKTAARSLLAGIFDLAGGGPLRMGGRIFFVALLSLSVVWTILETLWLVLLYAPERFEVSQMPTRWTKRLRAVAFAFLAAPTLIGAFWESRASGQAPAFPLLVGAALGIIVAVLLLLGINAATERQAKIPAKRVNRAAPSWFVQQENFRGAFNQSFAPLATMLHVRSTGQLAHTDEDTSLIERVKFQSDV